MSEWKDVAPTFPVRGDVRTWGSLKAACLIVSVPITVLYNLFVERSVAGITGGAVE
jgi:multiple sugar transport system permease protein